MGGIKNLVLASGSREQERLFSQPMHRELRLRR
jgi:hypothetical protein